MVKLQTKSEIAVCSSVGDIKAHEKKKRLSQAQRIQNLQDCYDKYGVKSNEFFTEVKPFIMWTAHKHCRGMEFSEDLVNLSYEELVIEFEGGYTTHYNELIYKKPRYQTEWYYENCKNIGDFVMKVVGSAVAKYRSKTYRRQLKYEDNNEDISQRIGFTDFEFNNKLYEHMPETAIIANKDFKYFKFNKALAQHLEVLKQTKPRDNVLYNYMMWQEAM